MTSRTDSIHAGLVGDGPSWSALYAMSDDERRIAVGPNGRPTEYPPASLKQTRPRVLVVGLSETDEWLHAGRSDLKLEAVHHADEAIAGLWRTLQSMPQYRGSAR